MKIFRINNTEIELKKNYAIKQKVDLAINSASGLLFMRTGTAKAIRRHSEKLNKKETKEYFKILNEFTNPVMKKYIETYKVKNWTPKQAQLSSFKQILKNKGPYKTGEVALDKTWSKKEKKHVLHVVGMTYHLKKDGNLDVDKVSEKSLTKILTTALKFIEKQKYKNVPIPILCTRGNYGLKPKTSLRSIINALKKVNPKNIKRIIICFESEDPRKTFDKLTKKDLQRILK